MPCKIKSDTLPGRSVAVAQKKVAFGVFGKHNFIKRRHTTLQNRTA